MWRIKPGINVAWKGFKKGNSGEELQKNISFKLTGQMRISTETVGYLLFLWCDAQVFQVSNMTA